MTNKAKKVLSILASTAVLAGFTADIALNSNPTTVNAAKKHKKKNAKKKQKQSPTKKSNKTNQNTNKNTANNANANNSQPSSNQYGVTSDISNTNIEPQSKYSSLADWYAANGIQVYNKYNSGSGTDSQEFNLGESNGNGGVIYPDHYDNEMYKEGQIIGLTFGDAYPNYAVNTLPQDKGKSLSQLYQESIDIYNSAKPYVQTYRLSPAIQIIGPNNQWGPNQ